MSAPARTGALPVTPMFREGAGTPLVLLHGITGSWRVWEPILAPLAEHHDVIAPTLIGHRGGPTLGEGVVLSIAALADGVEAVMDEAGVEHAHLVGNSLGGWVGFELARRGRATSFVALSPAGGWRGPADLRRVARLVGLGTTMLTKVQDKLEPLIRRPRSRRLLLQANMVHGERVPAATALDLLEDVAGCTIMDEFLVVTERDGPFAGDMADVRCPILVAWGEKDRTLPFRRYGPPLLDLVPQAQRTTLAGCGHVPMFDDPGLVVRTILGVTGPADAAATTTVAPSA